MTAISVREILFDQLAIAQQSANAMRRSDEVILVVGAAGGGGSILIQLAKGMTGVSVIATALREAADMGEQGRLLNRVAELVDQARIQTTLSKNLGPICAANLKAAHAELEGGRAIGKIVLQGF